MRLVDDRVLVKLLPPDDLSKSGLIVIPDMAKFPPQEGYVVAVGPGARSKKGERIPLDVEVGDRVLVGKYSGLPHYIEGEEHIFIREHEIIGKLIEETP